MDREKVYDCPICGAAESVYDGHCCECDTFVWECPECGEFREIDQHELNDEGLCEACFREQLNEWAAIEETNYCLNQEMRR